MLHRKIGPGHPAGRDDALVHRPHPAKAGLPPHQPLPPAPKAAPAPAVKAGVIGQHHQVAFSVGQRTEGSGSGLRQQIVGVQPEQVVHGALGKGKVPGGGKVIPPGEIADLGTIGGPDLPGPVPGAGVRQDDLVHPAPDPVQAAAQHRFLVPDDHAQADGSHISSAG